MSGVVWWVPWALAFCTVTFTAALGVLVFLAGRGVWRLVAAYRRVPAHAGLVPERLWPLVGDPRAGSMQLADDLGWPGLEVAHEGDWLEQTRHDLAPAVLDSGPGGPSLAPGPDPDDWLFRQERVGPYNDGPAQLDEPEPEPVVTVAGRLVETRDEWLRRLTAAAGPGWTYAGVPV